MESAKRSLKGSKKRDLFKWAHKQPPWPRTFYCTDADLCLVSKHPPGTVAYIDYKDRGDDVTFAEGIQYNEWVKHAPVFIVSTSNPENGPFLIKRYLSANWHPNPIDVTYGEEVVCPDREALISWEKELRAEYTRRGGWSKS